MEKIVIGEPTSGALIAFIKHEPRSRSALRQLQETSDHIENIAAAALSELQAVAVGLRKITSRFIVD